MQDSVPCAEAGVKASDVLFCSLRLTYVELVLGCIAIAADLVTKDDGLLSKVRLMHALHAVHIA